MEFQNAPVPSFGLHTMKHIISDLMAKVGDDITGAMMRTISISPEPHLPVAMAGGAAALGIVAGVLNEMSSHPDSELNDETILLAALLCAHTVINPKTGVEQACRDLQILRPSTPKTAERQP